MNDHFVACCILALGMAIGPAGARAADATQAVVYAWNPTSCHPAAPSKAALVQRVSGATAACITASGGEWNTWIRISPGTLHGNHDYTALLKYEIVTPPKFPGTFYMFARSKSLGEHRDIWQTWLGDAHDAGTARLTLRLPAADDWEFDVGCQGAGSEIIDSLQIVGGTGFVYLPAETSAAPMAAPSNAPAATGASAITIAPPVAHAGPVLSATDFGLVADGPAAPVAPAVAASNSVVVAQAIDACRRLGASRLLFPKGVYRFNGEDAIPFNTLSNLVIDGQGSEFIFQKIHHAPAVTVQDCTRCVIKDLRLDWDWSVSPLASLCRVVSASADGLSCSLLFPDLDTNARQRLIHAPWMKLLPMDPETFRLRAPQGLPAPVSSFTWLTGNVLRVTFKQPVRVTTGETYCVRHQYYEMSAFRIGDSHDLLFENVTIYSMPGMGWVSRGEMHHWGFRNCRIVRREGSRRPMTTMADGFHVTESLGDLLLENCAFTGMGDDCVNIHDNCFQGVERTDDHTLKLVGNHRWRFKVEAGHRIALFHADYSPLGFQSAINAVAYKGNDTILTLADTLPAALSPQTIVFNQHYRTSNVRIANCRFYDTAGRGILTDAQNLTIENCVFDHVFGQGVQLAIDIVPALWAEGRPTTNVVMRGNRFQSLNAAARVDGAGVCTFTRWPAGATAYPLYRTILIESNRFVSPLGPAISLQSCRDVVVRDNTIDATGTPAGATPLAAAFVAAYSADLTLAGNRWDVGATVVKPGVLFDPETTTHVTGSGNSVRHQ